MPRIAPLDPPYTPDVKSSFDEVMRGAEPLMLFRVIARSERAWKKLRGGSLLDRGPLSLRQREIVIDRTCALAGCEYEWGVHVKLFAAAAQLTGEQVRATVIEGAAAPWRISRRRSPLPSRSWPSSSCCAPTACWVCGDESDGVAMNTGL